MPATTSPLNPSPTHSPLLSALATYGQDKFTGCLTIAFSQGQTWALYLSLGRLVWATGGAHPVRRWRRHLIRHCPSLEPSHLELRDSDPLTCWDYDVLVLMVRRQVSPVEPIIATIRGIVAEVTFDLVQATAQTLSAAPPCFREQPGRRPSKLGLLPQTSTLDLQTILAQAQAEWQAWTAAGLGRQAPDLAPVIAQSLALQRQTPPQVYRNLTLLANGRRSLRDIAWMAKQEVLSLGRSLLPYYQQRLIAFQTIPDLPPPSFLQPDQPEAPAAAEQPSQPLVACIDDHPQVGELLEGILSEAGYRCLTITDPIQALPLLLQHRPDLILLDLVMPIANGYEICTQIRRVKQFQATPIVIVTGRDGLVDRVRAKLVGATDFLSKPIAAEPVLAIAQRWLPVPPP